MEEKQEKKEDTVEDYFIKNYATNYWLVTARSYKKLIEEDTLKDDKILSKMEEKTRKNIYKFHLQMLAIHFLEAFFALLIGFVKKSNNVVSYVYGYRTKDLDIEIEKIAQNGMKGIAPDDFDKAIKNVFYYEVNTEVMPSEHKQQLADSMKEINMLLKFLAEWYLEQEAYHDYKHGMRTFIGEGSAKYISKDTEEIIQKPASAYWHITRDEKGIGMDYYMIDHKETMKIINKTHELLKLMMQIRKDILNGKANFSVGVLKKGSATKDVRSKEIRVRRAQQRFPVAQTSTPKEKIDQNLFEMNGKGTIKRDDLRINGTFKFIFSVDQGALLFLDVDPFSEEGKKILNEDLTEFEFEGISEDGSKLSIDKTYLVHKGISIGKRRRPFKFKAFSGISIKEKENKDKGKEKMIFLLSNLIFTGSERTHFPSGEWSNDHFFVKIGRYCVKVQQIKNYEEIKQSLEKGEVTSAITAELTINTQHKNEKKIREIISDLCWLMSFATGNTVSPFGEIYIKEDDVIKRTFTRMRVEKYKGGEQLIPKNPFEALPNFLEEVYPNYKKYKKDLGLNLILNYHELMKRNPILEAKCGLAFILLECLSDNAQNYYQKRGDPIKNSLAEGQKNKVKEILPDHEIITEKMIAKVVDEIGNKYPTLPDSINHIMKDFGMKYKKGSAEADIFQLRKGFIHKGIFLSEEEDKLKTFTKIVHFIDRLLLHILRYTGEYLDITDRYKHKQLFYKKSK